MFSPPEMITSFLRSTMWTLCRLVPDAEVAGVEEAVVDRRVGLVGLLPVALEDDVRAGADLADVSPSFGTGLPSSSSTWISTPMPGDARARAARVVLAFPVCVRRGRPSGAAPSR